jgi:hypothetical protein
MLHFNKLIDGQFLILQLTYDHALFYYIGNWILVPYANMSEINGMFNKL